MDRLSLKHKHDLKGRLQENRVNIKAERRGDMAVVKRRRAGKRREEKEGVERRELHSSVGYISQ